MGAVRVCTALVSSQSPLSLSALILPENRMNLKESVMGRQGVGVGQAGSR